MFLTSLIKILSSSDEIKAVWKDFQDAGQNNYLSICVEATGSQRQTAFNQV